MASNSKQTPMMAQYDTIRSRLAQDTILLFRLGDFYEMFKRDAEEGARILGITLTRRHDYAMAGIPYHAADTYIDRLLKAGKKVAICDQVETPKPGKLVRRSLTRILTPGTALEERQLDSRHAHCLLAITPCGKEDWTASWLDLSTGWFMIADPTPLHELLPTLNAISPREVLLPEALPPHQASAPGLRQWLESLPQTEVPGYHFDLNDGTRKICETLGVMNLQGFGIEDGHPGLGAAAALLIYAEESLCAPPGNIRRIQRYESEQTLRIDPATQRHLELFFSSNGNQRKGSLIDAIDHTRTPQGARLLENWMISPAQDIDTIQNRQNIVRDLQKSPLDLIRLQEILEGIRDIPRILGRLRNRIRNPRELGAIRQTLDQLPELRQHLLNMEESSLQTIGETIECFPELADLLTRSLEENLPSQIKEGGVIAKGYHEELDRIRTLSKDSKSTLSAMEKREQTSTGIKNLRIKYNGAFGYFIEITKSNLSLVPGHYIRKQTMVNAERYVTDELKTMEREILRAEEKSLELEDRLFAELVEKVVAHADPLMEVSSTVSRLDVLAGWAELARQWNYCQPQWENLPGGLHILGGRHPVVEQSLQQEVLGLGGTDRFVPNDTHLQSSEKQIALITGPNMAGKSTYIRQVALIAYMAHIGCWVPADECRLGLIDRIFSRVGASDELSRGNSTFMVEMNETANILNHATTNSLIVLDEIGRGTSTYDGLSIAWSIIEYLHRDPQSGPKTLFATHYHELTRLAERLPRLRNYSVSVKEWNDQILFIREVVEGPADRSYGIQVARLAGLPEAVIDRAKIILRDLEGDGYSGQVPVDKVRPSAETPTTKTRSKKTAPPDQLNEDPPSRQLELFGS